MKKKIIAVFILCLLLTSCSADKIDSLNSQKKADLELQSVHVLREAGNAEDHLFFDGLELGTEYTDMGRAIDPDGLFGDLSDEEWDEEDFGQSLTMSTSAYTSDKDFVDGTLLISKEDYFDDYSLIEVTVALIMDETKPDMDEFIGKKDDLYEKFLSEINVTEMEKISAEEIPGQAESYRDKYLAEGYETEMFEGYMYDDTQTRTRYFFVATYYTKDNPDENDVIAEIICSKNRYQKTYSLEKQ